MLKILGVYVSASTSKRVKDDGKNIVRSMKELLHDVIDGKWADVFRGRRASNLRQYEAVLINARKGDRIAQFLLPFHRRVMSISKEDAREILIELGNTETSI
jgi:hypothetical protein